MSVWEIVKTDLGPLIYTVIFSLVWYLYLTRSRVVRMHYESLGARFKTL